MTSWGGYASSLSSTASGCATTPTTRCSRPRRSPVSRGFRPSSPRPPGSSTDHVPPSPLLAGRSTRMGALGAVQRSERIPKVGTAHETAHEVRAYSPDPTDCHIDACTDVCGCSQRARPQVDTSIISSTTRASPPSSTCTARQCRRHAAAPSPAGANRRDVRHASRSASSGRARTLQLALNCGSGLCSERCCGAAVVARLSWRVTTC